MLKEYPSDGSIFFAPMEFTTIDAKLPVQESGTFVSQAINDVAGAAFMKIVDLRARALQVAVVVKQLESPQNLLWTFKHQRDDLWRTQKAVPVNEPDDFAIALVDLNWRNRGRAFEAGKMGRLHLSIMAGGGTSEEDVELCYPLTEVSALRGFEEKLQGR